MDKITEQIRWYDQNATRKDDDLIKANLNLIDTLCAEIENSEDRIFLDKIIGTFCEILEIQRNVINDLVMETKQGIYCAPPTQHQYLAAVVPADGFTSDKQLQEAFTAYCLSNGKSSYTANDYCSRIKNLWKSYYAACEQGELPEDIGVNEELVRPGSPLLNAYHHMDELNCYVHMQIATAQSNRNWLNTRAAFNQFDKFKMSIG